MSLPALGVTCGRRNPQLPDVPTMQEAMNPGFVLEAWFGLWAPAGTPPEIVRRLNAGVGTLPAAADFRAKLSSDGSEIVVATPEEFAAYVKSEAVKWERIVRDSGAKVD